MFVARKVMWLLCCLVAVMVFSSSVFSNASADDSISLWVRSDNENLMVPVIKAYNDKGGDQIKLQIIPAQEMMQKIATSYMAGQAPDIVSLDLIYTPQLINADMLIDITDYAKSLPFFDSLSKGHIEVGSYDGKIYGLPFSVEDSFLMYNKEVLRKAGLDPEKPAKNWKEMTDQCVQISKSGKDVYGFYTCAASGGWLAFTFNPFIWASGGNTLSADGTKAMLNTKPVREAIAFHRDLFQKGCIPESAATDAGGNRFTGFIANKVGYMCAGTFMIGVLLNDYPNIDFGVTPIPGKDGGYATFAGGDNIVFLKGLETKKLEAAKKFLSWIYSVEGQTLMAKHGSIPSRGDIALQALSSLDPRYQMPARILSRGHTPYSLVYSELFLNNNGPWTEMINRGIFTDENIDELTDQAQEQVQLVIDDNL